MAHLLIDVNVPDHFSLWQQQKSVEAVGQLNRLWSDETIWQYAQLRSQVIVTRDIDFLTLAQANPPPPRVVLLRIGNLKMREFYVFMHEKWPAIAALLLDHRLVQVFRDRLIALPI